MASRKLQGEIDRVFKKIDEGVQVFEQIWDKVYSATTSAQKEKYEGDLKKEIKKLQRLRDQIKTWQGDSSIKDKSKLDSSRKLIEEKMEKFKICEKETKTKAFSKEGLAQDRTDPKQRAKAGVGEWVKDSIARLEEQTEELEAEIESLSSGKRRKRQEENPRVAQLKEVITRHKHHVTMLERVLRAVYNDAVTPLEASDLKDSVDYYIQSNQDPGFYEDVEMYDELNLDSTPTPQAGASKKGRQNNRDTEEDEENSLSSKKSPASPRNARTSRSSNTKSSSSTRTTSPKTTRSSDQSPPPAEPTNSHVPQGPSRDSTPARPPHAPLMSSVVKGSTTAKPNPKPVSTSASVDPTQVVPPSSNDKIPMEIRDVAVVEKARDTNGTSNTASTSADSGIISASTNEEATVAASEISSTLAPPPVIEEAPNSPNIGERGDYVEPLMSELEVAWGQFQQRERGSVPKMNNPSPKSTAPAHAPRHPAAVPSFFPSVAAPIFDGPEIFARFDPDTLFFIFYYQQGTYQQYLAARELKRQGWRFHKKYLTWFQRHDDPKISTDEYETGTFIYFDYANVVVRGQGSSGWCQRIKSEFVFEYRFLEDELV